MSIEATTQVIRHIANSLYSAYTLAGKCTIYGTVYSAVYSLQCMWIQCHNVYSGSIIVCCTPYTVRRTLYAVHCTVYQNSYYILRQYSRRLLYIVDNTSGLSLTCGREFHAIVVHRGRRVTRVWPRGHHSLVQVAVRGVRGHRCRTTFEAGPLSRIHTPYAHLGFAPLVIPSIQSLYNNQVYKYYLQYIRSL